MLLRLWADSKWAVLKAGDPTTKSGDKTVTSRGKETSQLVGCSGHASRSTTSFSFPPGTPSPQTKEATIAIQGDTRLYLYFLARR